MNLYVIAAWVSSRVRNDDRGASMVEYSLLLGLLVVVALVAVQAFGQSVSNQFSMIADKTQ
jgi:pilus assembly protein Flp/PilA